MQQLKTYLTTNKLSQSEFARLNGFSQQIVSNWVNNKDSPSTKNYLKLKKIIKDLEL
jgi:DNA-binding transcriptional regulator YiaG